MTRKLDLLVAASLGETPPEGYEKVGDHWEKEVPELYEDGTYARSWSIHMWPPYYSTSDAVAFALVDELREQGYGWRLLSLPDDRWGVRIMLGSLTNMVTMSVRARTRPLAICQVILRAHGVDEAVIQVALIEED